ncbi:MAG: 4Fe-4S dicluster domain-containing protein [Desulfuromonas sp.]|nr:4Fe-4S dicluster domain-containing protein [Desulfuromonas sp.]
MSQYAMVIDLEKCVGCHACAIACRAEWEVPVGKDSEGREQHRCWVQRLGPAKTPHGLSYTYYPGLCNHCDEPSCVAACPYDLETRTFVDPVTGKKVTMEVSATWKDPFDGTVQINKEVCWGCGACADACPYGARYVNEEGEDPKADKCTFCVERLAVGKEPACVQTCLAGARIFGDLSDPDSEVSKYVKKGAVGLESSAVKIGPNVLYFGNKRDMSLLKSTCTPLTMPVADINTRRLLMGRLAKSSFKGLKNFALIGMVGGLMIENASDKDSEE